ncbi:MAG: ATP-binding protein [Candidatus Brocadiales bacterium]
MSLYEIISLIGFLLGTILHSVLSVLIVQRKDKTSSEIVFLFLVISVAMWNLGNSISLFSLMLFGRNIPSISYLADAVAYIGIGFMPSLLLHTATAFLFESARYAERSQRQLRRLAKSVMIATIYLPVIIFAVAIKKMVSFEDASLLMSMSPLVKPFVLWLITSLLISAAISRNFSQTAEEKEERKFHFFIFWALVFVSILIAFTILLGGRNISFVGDYFLLAAMLSSIFPSIVFSYYVYRYNYMEFVLRRSVFYSFLTLIIICFYYFGVKQFSKFLEHRYSLNSKVLEAIFVIGLVYWFPKIKEKVQGMMRNLLFRRIADSEYLLNDLSRTISADSLLDLPKLLESIVEQIKNAVAIKKAAILLFKSDKTQRFGDSLSDTITRMDLENIINNFLKDGLSFLNRHEIKDVSIINEMKSLDALLIFPIFEDRNLIGLLILGRTRRGLSLPSDNLDQLMIIANQIGSTIGKSKLIDEKLKLERKIYENEKLSTLGRLSTSVAHEVKNPLSSIKTIVQVMREDLKHDASVQECLSIIVDEIDRLDNVVNQLLQFTRPKGEVKTNVKIGNVLSSVLLVLNHEARKNNINISCKISKDLPMLNTEDGSLKEVFFNIINNAIQAMPDGGELAITAVPQPQNNTFEITFADTGPGIPQDAVDKVFDPFYTTKQSGTGLGLSIVKKKLEEMDGSIRVENNTKGAMFIINLPATNPVLVTN